MALLGVGSRVCSRPRQTIRTCRRQPFVLQTLSLPPPILQSLAPMKLQTGLGVAVPLCPLAVHADLQALSPDLSVATVTAGHAIRYFRSLHSQTLAVMAFSVTIDILMYNLTRGSHILLLS